MSDDTNTSGNDSGADDLTPAEKLSLRGDQLAADGLYREAVDAYKESIERDAAIPGTYVQLARAYYSNREFNEADAALWKMKAVSWTRGTDSAVLDFYFSEMSEAADSSRFEAVLRAARYSLDHLYQGIFISPNFGPALQQLERIAQEDSDSARKRSAWLFGSYMNFFAYQFIRLPEPKEPLYWYEQALQYPEPEGERDPLEVKIHYRAGMEYWLGVGNKVWWQPTLSEEDYWRLPQYEEACKAFEKSVELYPLRDWGAELHAENIFPFEMLSASYIRMGRLAEGVEMLRKGLALIPDNKYGGGGTRDQFLSILIYNLDHTASIPLSEGYEKLGEYQAALECLVKPVDLLIEGEKYAEALSLVRRAEEIVKGPAVEVSPKIAGLLDRIETAIDDSMTWSDKLAGKGSFSEAISLVQSTLVMAEERYSGEPLKIAELLDRLAELYCKAGDHSLELPIRERVLEIESTGLENDDPQLLFALYNLAFAYAHSDRWDEAEPLFKRSLGIWGQDTDHDVDTGLGILGALAIIYERRNNPEQAVSYGERALDILKANREPDYKSLLALSMIIGLIHKRHGNHIKAEEYLNQAVEVAMREEPIGESDEEAVRAQVEKAQEKLNEEFFDEINTSQDHEP